MKAIRKTERVQNSASLAGEAILLEIGAAYGIVESIRQSAGFTASEIAAWAGLPESVMMGYLEALKSAGLIDLVDKEVGYFKPNGGFEDALYDVGYLAWGLEACGPLIAHAREFAQDFDVACSTHRRDGGLIARTSKWMGERAFYPHAENAIVTLRPKKIVDLGAGSAGLLIRCLRQLPDTQGIAIDMSAAACEAAEQAVRAAGLLHRMLILQMRIEDLVQEPDCLDGAETFHAGFVLHDLLPDQEEALDGLLKVCRNASEESTFLIVDGIPYAEDPVERAFSAAFTFLHKSFMGRVIQTEQEWVRRLNAAGFPKVNVERLGIPGGRLFLAHSA